MKVFLREPATIEDVIIFLQEQQIPIFKEGDDLSSFEVLLNGANIRGSKGLKTEIKDGDIISFIPLAEGG